MKQLVQQGHIVVSRLLEVLRDFLLTNWPVYRTSEFRIILKGYAQDVARNGCAHRTSLGGPNSDQTPLGLHLAAAPPVPHVQVLRTRPHWRRARRERV